MNKVKQESMGALNGNEYESSIGLGASDEDSFVVLERTPSHDVNGGFLAGDSLTSRTICKSCPTEEGLFPINTPSLFKGQPLPSYSTGLLSMDMSPEEIQVKLNDVLRENLELKETLHQNNLAMKQQLNTLRTWQEAVHKSHHNHKEKFAETKDLIIKLRAENEELKGCLKATQESKNEPSSSEVSLQAANAALTTQVNSLQNQVAALSARNSQVMRNAASGKKEQELIALTEQLNRQLEIAERSRRQMSMDVEKLQAQKGRLERDIVIVNVDLESQKQRAEAAEKKIRAQELKPATSHSRDGELEALRAQLKEHQDVIEKMTNIQMDHVAAVVDLSAYENKQGDFSCNHLKQIDRYPSLDSWMNVTPEIINQDKMEAGESERVKRLQQELDDVKKLLADEQRKGQETEKMRCEAQQHFQNLFSDYQSVLQDLEDLNRKPNQSPTERQSLSYHEAQVKGFTEKVDRMTAQIIDLEDSLTQRTQCLAEMKERNKQLEADNESIPVLQIQMQVYQADFNAEREARESLAGEKERLAEDLRLLQRRNQQLLNELKLYQQNYADHTQHNNAGWNTISSPGRNHARENTPPSPGPHDL